MRLSHRIEIEGETRSNQMALRTNERPTLDPDSETLRYSEHALPLVQTRSEDDDLSTSDPDPPPPSEPEEGEPRRPPDIVDGTRRLMSPSFSMDSQATAMGQFDASMETTRGFGSIDDDPPPPTDITDPKRGG